MKNNASLLYSFCLVIGDFLALLAAFVFAYILRVSLDPRPLVADIHFTTYLGIFLILLPFWLIIFAMLGLYTNRVFENRFSEFGRLLVGCFIGILFLIGYDFVSKRGIFPARLVPVYGFIVGFLFVLLFRTIARASRRMLFGFGVGINNVLIVGNTRITEELVESLKDVRITGYRVVGVVSQRGHHIEGINANRHFDSFQTAIAKLKHDQIHSIIQTELYSKSEQNDEVLTYAQENHVAYRFVPGNSELFVGNIDVDLFHSMPVIAVHQTALVGWGRIVKRLFDFVFGIIFLIITLPFMIIIGLIIAIFDHGQPVYRQRRLSRFDTEIRIYKFRTQKHAYHRMTPEEGFAKMGKPELAKKFRENGDHLDNDPRISRMGRFLRKTSLDELPQLLNVVKGELSLVGPRPLEPFELNQFAKKNLVLSVKPGLTGLAQISGRRDIPFEERRKLDLFYVQNWSFWNDLVIILKTFSVVLFHRGESG